jgi:PhzF family phenazine biosynthesis protein
MEDKEMQKIAKEMNLSETSFLENTEKEDEFKLRWFTPTTEVPLCGHGNF